ncbi:unnamed protein product [Didymodactylos carnosus]|uniref:LRP2-binding protein n=1 Tax=Didymodactylos carnosus TaxID=1234261 RepID=A0A813Z231_9BILA|nr:unnamed protein product [Didymodactylos carnosus]CAF1127112.1 unnamed protein product [Didymodactylos carnosus]CAF3676250.1 unnamed protein product [Didymodactylos carnosus]CAF3905885.1 unnamed protein product [Didymodactylos carnosus]
MSYIEEQLATNIPSSLGARDFMIERLILRDNTIELLRQNGKSQQVEDELLSLAKCECNTGNIFEPTKCKCRAREAHFLVAQFYYDTIQYLKAWQWYSQIKDVDLRALYQLAVMCFEEVSPPECKPGYGVQQAEEKAESWWLLAASDDKNQALMEAMTALAFFYSRKYSNFYNMTKAFEWHYKAAKKGSLESLGAVGSMYLFGLGTKQSLDRAVNYLRDAAERGNVYAMGLLTYCYYTKKLYTKATDLAQKLICLDNVEELSRATCCLPQYIKKGIALSAFVLGRCYELGNGIKPDSKQALKYYRQCFKFDADICSLLQDYVAHQKI